VLTTPLEFGPLFCIAARPPVAQAGFALEPFWAETGWTPKKFLGQHHWKFLPPEGPTFMGSSCHGSGFMVVNAP